MIKNKKQLLDYIEKYLPYILRDEFYRLKQEGKLPCIVGTGLWIHIWEVRMWEKDYSFCVLKHDSEDAYAVTKVSVPIEYSRMWCTWLMFWYKDIFTNQITSSDIMKQYNEKVLEELDMIEEWLLH